VAICPAGVTHQDVVTPILGASAGLGGMTLVFLGLLINVNRSLPPDAPKAVRGRVRAAAWRVFAAFAMSIFSVSVALARLVIPGGDCLYWASVLAFAADLVAIVGVALVTTRWLLR